MELLTSISLVRAVQRMTAAGPIPPDSIGLLPDLQLETNAVMTPANLSTDFTGPGMSFALAPGSSPLPSGLSLSSGGILSGTPVAETGPVSIMMRGTNTHGFADSGFSLTVVDMLLDFTVPSPSGLTDNPTYGESAQTGVALSVTAGAFTGPEPGVITYQWKTVESGSIAGATSATYTPNAALYDGETLYCTVSPDGYPSKDSPAAVIRQAPPLATGTPSEQFWDVGTGDETIDMTAYASGDALVWSVSAQGVSISPATGLLSIRTKAQAIGALASVVAQNTGGAVAIAFTFHIEDLAAGPGPDLRMPVLNDATNTIALTLDEPGTIYWRRDSTGTNPDPIQVMAGGGFDSGSFAALAGQSNVALTFAGGNDGLQEISFVAAVSQNEKSLVRTVAIEIDTVAPTLSGTAPQTGAGDIGADVTPVLTFSEPVSPGSGTVVLYDVTADAPLQSFDVVADAGTGAGMVEIAGSDLTIRPFKPLAGARDYAVLIDPGAVHDVAGNDFAGISSVATLGFSTGDTAVVDTEFGADFSTNYPAVWSQMQSNAFNTTPEHRSGETWGAYPATLSDGGIVGVKFGNCPQLRFSVPVEIGKSYAIDADLPIGEGTWAGPLRIKIGSDINLNDYTQIDATQGGQPRVFELRGQAITATTMELWFAVIVEANGGGATGGNPALAMLRIQEI